MKPQKRIGAAPPSDEPWLMSLSYERDGEEEILIADETVERFSKPLGLLFYLKSFLFLLFVVFVTGASMELSRRFAPYFANAEDFLLYYGKYAAVILPPFMASAVAIIFLRRMYKRRAMDNRIGKIRATGWVDIEVYETGLHIMYDGFDTNMDWEIAQNVSHNADYIFIDVDHTVFYIPQRAFRGKMEFLMRAKELRRLWQNRMIETRNQREHSSKTDDSAS